MNTNDFTTSILVDKSPEEAYNAIKNFRSWWCDDIEGDTDKLGETFFYHYKDAHLTKMKPIEMIPNKKLIYLVTDNFFGFTKDKTEWVNTKLDFEISTSENKTKIEFTHKGLVPEYECYSACHDAWTGLIQVSLYNLISTGIGQPIPKSDPETLNMAFIEEWKNKA